MSNYINNEFKIAIKEWMNYDDNIQLLNSQLKELRSKRNNVKTQLTNYMENNQLTQTKFRLSDGSTFKYNNVTQYKPITFKLLKQCLNNYFNDEELAVNVCKFIKERREKVVAPDIKRYLQS